MTDVIDTTADEDVETFPANSFRDAAIHLRRPFTAAAVKFKVQSLTKDETKALVVAYIDARLVVERLNLIVPHLWSDEYEMVGAGLMCHLTVDGITRRDVGEGKGKALFSDALKRAAVKFGVGVPLYAIPQTWLLVNGQQVKKVGNNCYMQDEGERVCRERYASWLRETGIRGFGEPLDHGDVDDSQGDHETHAPPSSPAPSAAPVWESAGITAEQYAAVEARFVELGQPFDQMTGLLDKLGVPAHADLAARMRLIDAPTALKVQKALANAEKPAPAEMPVPEELT